MTAHNHSSDPDPQYFHRIGLFEAINGDIVIRGRAGERDHLCPLEKLPKMYEERHELMLAMCRAGQRGWDTVADMLDDYKAKILEAIAQRRSMNIDIPKEALDFEKRWGRPDKKAQITVG